MPCHARPLLVSLVALCGACAGARAPNAGDDPVAALSAGHPAAVRRDLATLRAATQPFHELSAAQAAGYPAGSPACIDSATGGMGRHYFDRAAYDDTLRIGHPEMLLYETGADGRLALVAVEYVVPFRLRSENGPPPRLFEQEFRKHERFRYWYLHVWAWKPNPAGLFADWNPAVRCP